MESIISGEAGYGATWRGSAIVLTVPGAPPKSIELPASSLRTLFAAVSDAKVVELSSENDVLRAIELEKSTNRALHLILMLLDSEETSDVREEIPAVLDILLSDADVRERAAMVMFSEPLPETAELHKAINLARNCSEVTGFLEMLEKSQPVLRDLVAKLRELPEELFSYPGHSREVEKLLRDTGVLSETVLAQADPPNNRPIENAKFEAFAAAQRSGIKDARSIVSAWFELIGGTVRKISKKEWKTLIAAESHQDRDQKQVRASHRMISGREAYERATAQIEEIKNLLRKLDIATARRYMLELKQAQIDNDDREYAAMSLCNISNFACDTYQFSFALEAASEAASTAPEDGRCWSQVADCQIHLGRFDEAEESLRQAEIWGERHFAASSRARMLRLKGDTDSAIEAFRAVIDEFPDAEDLFKSLCGLGEILRDTQRFDESLVIYDKALSRFQFQSMCWQGKAQTLATIGELEEACSLYERALELAEASVYVFVGLGRALQEMGNYERAEEVLNQAVSKFPLEPAAYRNLGACLRAQGKLQEALRIYRYMKSEFPYDYRGFRGVSETYVELRDFGRAEREFADAIKLFPNEVVLRTRQSNLYKKWGKFETALQYYSQTVQDFPLSHYAKFGQADLLKELYEYDKALWFYEQISAPNSFLDPMVCRAAIYVTLGDFDRAISLLPTTPPKTRSDWVAAHIRGMSLLKSGKLQEAEAYFEDSLNNIPFASQRAYFASSIAIARLRQRNYADALKSIKGQQTFSSNILHLHSYAGLNRARDAERAYSALLKDCPNNVIPLRDELAAQAGLTNADSGHDPEWIFNQEIDMLSLAATQQLAA